MATDSDGDIERFDRWAPTYDRSIAQRFFFVPIHRRILARLGEAESGEPPSSVVDVGCGTGRLLRAVSLRWPEASLCGVDPAEKMVSEAVRLNPATRFELGTAEALPLEDASADIVTSSLSFHHWADQEKGILEIFRVLRPGGIFCLADHVFPLAKLIGERMKNRKEVREMLTAAGFDVFRQRTAVYPFVLISLARKPEDS
jgi:ubiquinone/menaquinone biosynthesis C-methylase UbiE